MKTFILILLGVASTVSAVSLDSCSRGESYWCSNIRVAKQCGAVQHCMTTIWKNTKLTQKPNDVCQYCENIVKDARDALTNNQTQAQVKNFLETACSVIPLPELSTECSDLVKNYLPELFALISSTLDPDTVCAALGLCSGFEDLAKQAESVAPQAPLLLVAQHPLSGDICVDCKTLVQDVKDIITNVTTEKQIEDLLKSSVCSQLGTFKDECDTMVTSYVPEIMDLLATQVDPATVCAALGFCQGGDKTLLVKMKLRKSALYQAAAKVQSEEGCILCKTVFTELQNLDKDKTVQTKVESFLKTQLCARLGNLKDECDTTVDTYGTMLFELLQNELDPDTDCQALGFCQATRSNNVDATRLNTIALKAPVKTKKVGSSTQCVLCEFVIKELDGILGQNASESEIQAALDKICSILPETIKDQCTAFVDQYAPVIIKLLLAELDPQQICTVIGLCSATHTATVKGDPECGVCETVIQYVDSLLEENSTVTQIEALLDKVCNFLPGNLRNECQSMVDQYGPAIIMLIAQFADPKEICTELGLCTAAGKTHHIKMEVIVPAKATLLGEKECTYGPAFWCASMDNAVKCKAVDHCKKHAWNN